MKHTVPIGSAVTTAVAPITSIPAPRAGEPARLPANLIDLPPADLVDLVAGLVAEARRAGYDLGRQSAPGRAVCPPWCTRHEDDTPFQYHTSDRAVFGEFEVWTNQVDHADGSTADTCVWVNNEDMTPEQARRLAAAIVAAADRVDGSDTRNRPAGATPGWAVDVYDDTAPGGFATRTFYGPKVTVPTSGPVIDDATVWVQAERSVPLPGHEDDPGLGGLGDRVFVATEWCGTAAELTPEQAVVFAAAVSSAVAMLSDGAR